MRTVTAGEQTVLNASSRQEDIRVKMANGSGTMIDLTKWVDSWKIEEDVDQPVAGMTIEFRRDSGTTLSLAPFREDSTLNRLDDGVTYSPQIQLNRRITFEYAVTAIGVLPSDSDYKLLFDGKIHDFDVATSSIPVTCRDLGGVLVDRWIEVEQNYGSVPGVALETVMQQELDAVLGGGAVTLFVEDAPAYTISPTFRQRRQSLSDALLALQQLRGFDTRYRWDNGTGTFRFTLRDPDRTKTTPDYTFGPSNYYDITKLELDQTGIRNALEMEYPTGGGNRATLTVTDSASIAEFDRQYQFFQEADSSPINTSGEATTMLDAALADLKDPKAEKEVTLPFFWPLQLGDLYRFTANGVHSNTDLDLAVVAYRHEGSRSQRRTYLTVRGSPSGGYLTWLRRARAGGTVVSRPPTATIDPLDTEPNNLSIALRFSVIPGSGGGGTVIEWVIHTKLSNGAESVFSSGNGSVLPLDTSILRAAGYDKIVRYVVTDTATGLSDTMLFTVPSSTSVPGNQDELPDGTTYVRTTPNEKTGAGRAYTAITADYDVAVRKIGSIGSTPTLSLVHVFWNGTNTIAGKDTAGVVTLQKTATSATETNALQFRVTFAVAYATAPQVLINGNAPFGSGAGGDFVVSAITTTYFEVSMVNATVLATGTTTYTGTFRYHVIES